MCTCSSVKVHALTLNLTLFQLAKEVGGLASGIMRLDERRVDCGSKDDAKK